MRFFTDGSSGINELRVYPTNKLKSDLNNSNKAFLDYLTSDCVNEILAKKLHLDAGNIYCDNTNLEESISKNCDNTNLEESISKIKP